MRKIYQKYFEIPEENKGIMGERVFFARLAVSIVCIMLCMGAMGFSAYAFFTASVSSNMNQIQAANFDLEIQIEAQTGTSSASYESEGTYKLQAGSIYEFKLEKKGNASTGYCQIVIVKDETTIPVYTRQFGKSTVDESPVETRTIQIKVTEETIVKFVPCWGTFNIEEKDRFDETANIIVVGNDKTVSFEKITTLQADGLTNNTVTNSPAVTSESTTTSTPSKIPSTTTTEPTTSTETTTPASTTTPTETTNTPENIVTPTEEKKDEAASSETEGDTTKSTESTDGVTPSTKSTE